MTLSVKARTLLYQLFEVLEASIIESIYPPGFHLVEDRGLSLRALNRTTGGGSQTRTPSRQGPLSNSRRR